jgi:beta-glucuronidase
MKNVPGGMPRLRRRATLGLTAGGVLLACAPAAASAGQPTRTPSRRSALRKVHVLEGPWRFQIDVRGIGDRQRWWEGGARAWGKVPVMPGAWDCYDESLWQYEGIAWLETTIRPGDFTQGGRVVLHFGRVMQVTEVWINGSPIGKHASGYTPFSFDVTSALRADGDNRLVVRVDNRPRIDRFPFAKQVEWIQYGGILEPVRLVSTSHAFLADVTWTTTPEGTDAGVRCVARVANGQSRAETFQIVATIDGQTRAASGTADVQIEAGESREVALSLRIPRAKLWSPQSPFLYNARVELRREGRPVDEVVERIGVRSIAIAGTDILLNGEKLVIKGFNRYDSIGRWGPTPPAALIRQDLAQIKRTGANTLRTHFPPDPVVMDLLDEMGFLLVHELPINWWGVDEWRDMRPIGKVNQGADVLGSARPALAALVGRDKNRPSVLMWSMANESATHTEVGGQVMRDLMQLARKLDPSRPVTFVVGDDPRKHAALRDADVVSFNLYLTSDDVGDIEATVYRPMVDNLTQYRAFFPDKPLVMMEFGREGVRGHRGDVSLTEEHQAAYLEAMWRALRGNPTVSGGVVWSWADYHHRKDFAFYAPYGPYGVVTFDRKPKRALAAVTRMFSE